MKQALMNFFGIRTTAEANLQTGELLEAKRAIPGLSRQLFHTYYEETAPDFVSESKDQKDSKQAGLRRYIFESGLHRCRQSYDASGNCLQTRIRKMLQDV